MIDNNLNGNGSESMGAVPILPPIGTHGLYQGRHVWTTTDVRDNVATIHVMYPEPDEEPEFPIDVREAMWVIETKPAVSMSAETPNKAEPAATEAVSETAADWRRDNESVRRFYLDKAQNTNDEVMKRVYQKIADRADRAGRAGQATESAPQAGAVSETALETTTFVMADDDDEEEENHVRNMDAIEEARQIPPFDPSVIKGIYKKMVELVCRGTTLPPQFAYGISKTIVGAKMAGKVTFAEAVINPCRRYAMLGETGCGKGASFERCEKICFPVGMTLSDGLRLKFLDSLDSGVGLKDHFFDPPDDWPIWVNIDEIATLGNKSKEGRNPDILDTLFELANNTKISRAVAKRQGGGAKTKNDAYLLVTMAGQSGKVYAKALGGRTDKGATDRLYLEHAVKPETFKRMPPIDPAEAAALCLEIRGLDYSGQMQFDPDALAHFDAFWDGLPPTMQIARWRDDLMLDCYLAAFGQGRKIVSLEDVDDSIKTFNRQVIIRRVAFRVEASNDISFYLGCLKELAKTMRKMRKGGAAPERVALTYRDFATKSGAYVRNEEHIFKQAWAAFMEHHLYAIETRGQNNHAYTKYLPLARSRAAW
jgi:hypothetical protein